MKNGRPYTPQTQGIIENTHGPQLFFLKKKYSELPHNELLHIEILDNFLLKSLSLYSRYYNNRRHIVTKLVPNDLISSMDIEQFYQAAWNQLNYKWKYYDIVVLLLAAVKQISIAEFLDIQIRKQEIVAETRMYYL
jgi:hypothetical protein